MELQQLQEVIEVVRREGGDGHVEYRNNTGSGASWYFRMTRVTAPAVRAADELLDAAAGCETFVGNYFLDSDDLWWCLESSTQWEQCEHCRRASVDVVDRGSWLICCDACWEAFAAGRQYAYDDGA